MDRKRVVITGMGTVNPIGNNVDASFESLKNGYCGIDFISGFDTTDFKVKIAAEVKDLDPANYLDKKDIRKMGRFTQFAVISAMEAWKDANFPEDINKDEIGVIIASGIGGLPNIEDEQEKGLTKGFSKISPYFVTAGISNMAAARVAIMLGLHGMCSCPVTACAGGTNAVGDAFHRIRDGYETVMLCGGAESSVSRLGIAGFSSMMALSASDNPALGCLPFDIRRGGFVMGEGAGVLVLEEYEHAKKRGAKIYAEVVGYGANCDAYHYTAPEPNGLGAAKCMELAIKDAGIDKSEINYINAHGTGTKLNDLSETKAIHLLFEEYADKICVSSTKSMTGHMLGAAGGVEAIFTALALNKRFIPPTIGLNEPDPECDLDYVANTGRNQEIEYAMSNSLGFGGHNASIVLKAYKE